MIENIYLENLRDTPEFLPMNMEELKQLGYDEVDFAFVTGDAYVDHPSFGAAIIGKLLWAQGFSVGIIAQPDWRKADSFKVFGKPKYGFLVTSGNVDSMVNHYTVAKKRRSKDYYSPNSRAGLRPDRALTVYSRKVRDIFGKNMPIVLGGIEASLRRLSHYDYWSDSVRKSVLIDSTADLLAYGMGERQMPEIAALLAAGVPVSDIRFVEGTVYKTADIAELEDYILLPSHEDACVDKRAYAKSFKRQHENTDHITSKVLAEKCGHIYVVQNRPCAPLQGDELDIVYGLRYARRAHPVYHDNVPSILEVKFSITSNRGCFGGCNFCALTYHQGMCVTSRGHDSMVKEAVEITKLPDFKGYIHDVGGPTANFHTPSCQKQEKHGMCKNKKCLVPEPCKNLEVSHTHYLSLLRKLRALPGVKKVFIRSGIRYDYLIYDKNTEFFEELCEHHISGQLKVAPEHISNETLKRMGKPGRKVYDRFVKKYHEVNDRLGKKQFLVPYLMSSHPGSDMGDAVELAEYLRDNNLSPEQVQDFYPTPGTVSTCMYYTGIDPLTMENVYVARSPHEKAMQRALIQYKLPQNYELVLEALTAAKRTDLIGFDKKCLIRPRQGYGGAKALVRTVQKPVQQPVRKETPRKKKMIRNVHKKKVK